MNGNCFWIFTRHIWTNEIPLHRPGLGVPGSTIRDGDSLDTWAIIRHKVYDLFTPPLWTRNYVPVPGLYWADTAIRLLKWQQCWNGNSYYLMAYSGNRLTINKPGTETRGLCQLPCKHAVSCQYRDCTGPMLQASAQYRPGTGTYWHVIQS